MAITRTYIEGSIESLQAFLDDLGIFSSVELSVDVITCKNGNNDTVLSIHHNDAFSWKFTVFLADSQTWEKTYSSTGLNWGYKCANGAFLVLNAGALTNMYSVLITKNSHGEPTFVFPDDFTARHKVTCLTYADVIPVSTYDVPSTSMKQTAIVPFATNADLDTISYTPNAFYMPYCQHKNDGYGRITLGNVDYLTDGYWAIKEN